MRSPFLGKLTVFALSLLTVGCQYRADVSVTGSADNLAIDVNDNSIPHSAKGISVASLLENIDGKYQTLWQIEAKNGCAADASHLVYGDTPPRLFWIRRQGLWPTA